MNESPIFSLMPEHNSDLNINLRQKEVFYFFVTELIFDTSFSSKYQKPFE
jgi:hypothetical protein